jgi:hypothetical protein
MINEQELNKKLAEWAEFVYDEGAEYVGGGGNDNQLMHGLWYPPDNNHVGSPLPPPFTQSLDACFKWLIPKLERNNFYHYMQISPDRTETDIYCIQIIFSGTLIGEGESRIPAFALTKAIQEVLHL